MAKPKKTEKKPYPKDLERQISKSEASELGPKMAAALEQISTLKDRKAATSKEWQGKIDAAELDLERMGEALRSGRIDESVMVYDEADERRLEVVTKRVDNNKIVDRRPMTADERQGSLPGTGPGDDAEEDPANDDEGEGPDSDDVP